MGRAINRDLGEDQIRAWRVAHSGLCMGGIMLMVFSLLVPLLNLSPVSRLFIVIPAIISGYGFAIGLPFGAITQNRGLSGNGSGKNKLVYLGNLLGAYGSLIATLALLIQVIRALTTR